MTVGTLLISFRECILWKGLAKKNPPAKKTPCIFPKLQWLCPLFLRCMINLCVWSCWYTGVIHVAMPMFGCGPLRSNMDFNLLLAVANLIHSRHRKLLTKKISYIIIILNNSYHTWFFSGLNCVFFPIWRIYTSIFHLASNLLPESGCFPLTSHPVPGVEQKLPAEHCPLGLVRWEFPSTWLP